jgi:hypothetical protein
MWLPTPIYERLPQFWFLLGLLFVAYGLYIGLDIAVSLGYIAVGFVCCIYGVGVAVVRFKQRGASNDNSQADDIDASLTQK